MANLMRFYFSFIMSGHSFTGSYLRCLAWIGAMLIVGKTYVLSVLGKVSPIDDVASGDWLTLLGTGATANLLRTKFDSTGIQVA
jgi:hypothetical protein